MSEPSIEEFTTFVRAVRAGEIPAGRVETHGVRALVDEDACADVDIELLAKVAMRPPAGLIILKYGSRSLVGSFGAGDGTSALLKYYQPAGVKHVTYGLRGSRCFQSWLAGIAMGRLNIPTPRPLMIAEWRRLGKLWLSQSFLATRMAAGSNLTDFVSQHHESSALMTKVAEQLQRAFATFARYRGVHGDLKANNILVTADGDISFIDLDGAEFLLPLSRWTSLREKDEARFRANWRNLPGAAKCFEKVFKSP